MQPGHNDNVIPLQFMIIAHNNNTQKPPEASLFSIHIIEREVPTACNAQLRGDENRTIVRSPPGQSVYTPCHGY